MTLQGCVLGNTFMGDGGPATHSSAGKIHRAGMRLDGNRICRGLSNPDHEPVTQDENAHMAIHQKTIAAEHCGELQFEHAANQIMQAFRKSCIIQRNLRS